MKIDLLLTITILFSVVLFSMIIEKPLNEAILEQIVDGLC